VVEALKICAREAERFVHGIVEEAAHARGGDAVDHLRVLNIRAV
jgi:hypothetical protein